MYSGGLFAYTEVANLLQQNYVETQCVRHGGCKYVCVVFLSFPFCNNYDINMAFTFAERWTFICYVHLKDSFGMLLFLYTLSFFFLHLSIFVFSLP